MILFASYLECMEFLTGNLFSPSKAVTDKRVEKEFRSINVINDNNINDKQQL